MFVYPFVVLGVIAVIYLLIVASKKKNYTKAMSETAVEQKAVPISGVLPGMTKVINGHEASTETTGGVVMLNCKVNTETPLKDVMINKNQLLNKWQVPPGRTKISLTDPEIDKKLLVYVRSDREALAVTFFQNNPIILQKIAELYSMQFCLGDNIWESNGVFCMRYKEQGLIKPEKVQEVSSKMIEIFTTLTQALPEL